MHPILLVILLCGEPTHIIMNDPYGYIPIYRPLTKEEAPDYWSKVMKREAIPVETLQGCTQA